MTAFLRSLDYRQSVLAIIVLAVVLRVIWAVAVPAIPVSDQTAYLTFAKNLAEHGVYGWTPQEPSAYWPVGTSAMFAVLYVVFGPFATASIVILNVIVGTAIVGLTIYLARLFFDETTALLAGLFMAIWPSQVAYVTVQASELPFTLLTLAGLAAWYAPKLPRLARPLLGGLAFAGAAYVRPVALLMPIVLWISKVPDWRAMRRQIPLVILTFIVMAVAIAPWSIRNTSVFGHFVLLSTNGGTNLWMGNNPETVGFYMELPAATATLNEYDRDKALAAEAMRYIVDEPITFLVRTAKKAVLLHASETIAVHWNAEGLTQRFGEGTLLPLKLLMQAFWMAALLLALIGLIELVRERGLLATILHPVVLIWAYFTAVYAVTVIQDRYHFPSHPFIAMLMAIGLLAAIRRFKGSASRDARV